MKYRTTKVCTYRQETWANMQELVSLAHEITLQGKNKEKD